MRLWLMSLASFLRVLGIAFLSFVSPSMIVIENKDGTETILNSTRTAAAAPLLSPSNVTMSFDLVLAACEADLLDRPPLEDIRTNFSEGVSDRFRRCSKGHINEIVVRIHERLILIPCSDPCPIANITGTEVYDIVPKSVPNRHIVIIITRSRSCRFLALADLQGDRIWVNGLTPAILSPGLVMHEWGHNKGIRHATFQKAEYGDRTCVMGGGWVDNTTCFNPPHAHALGWAVPSRELQGANMTRDAWTQFTLMPNATAAIDRTVYLTYNDRMYVHLRDLPEYYMSNLFRVAKPNMQSPLLVKGLYVRWRRNKKRQVAVVRLCKGENCTLRSPVVKI